MAEEHRFQPPRLCVNNCGFFGSPATQNLCSKCFRDLQLKGQESSSAKHALNQTLASAATAAASTSVAAPRLISEADIKEVVWEPKVEEPVAVTPPQEPTRCTTCRRRVGLTGFKCRCGLLCCGAHRYPEQHGCSFDFKGTGKEQIAKANPIVKAEKLEKI